MERRHGQDRRGRPGWAMGLLLVALLLAMPAQASQRVALVIGNGAYAHTVPLNNPPNDARAVAAALQRLGFAVTRVDDVDKPGLERQLAAFRQRSRNAELALFYYAGHAIQVDGRNYLVPVDAEVRELGDISLNLMALGAALQQLQGDVNVVILDACRDNPFARELSRSAAQLGRNLGATRGLGREETLLGGGTYLMLAAAPDTVAQDGPPGGHSPYTAALLQHLETPDLDLRFLQARVRQTVEQVTRRAQSPEAIDRLPPRPIFLAGPAVDPVMEPLQALPVAPGTGVDSQALELAFWQTIQNSRNAPDFEAYLRRFPDGLFAELAKNRIAAMGMDSAPTRPEPAPATTPSQAPVASRLATLPATGVVQSDRLRDGSQGPDLVFVRGGSFLMGTPSYETGRNPHGDEERERQHRVTVGDVWIGRYAVTFDEYDRFARATGRDRPGDGRWGRGQRPVINVSWDDAMAYARWLSEQTGQRYRLPTEAEWEHAARAGTTTARHWGDAADEACRYANVHDETSKRVNTSITWEHHGCDDRHAHTSPVGSFAPNAWGLYDMLGNVWEWTCSVFDLDYGGAEQRCDASGERRVLRGGSWLNAPDWIRSALRFRTTVDYRGNDVGFRLARSP